MDQVVCPACEEPVTFQNKSFCGCNQQECKKKPCPPKVVLPYKACALKKWAKTECGCDKQYYDTQTYCDSHNKDAAANTCSSKCFKNVVLSGKGHCGCDKAECVRINEDCKQLFTGWNCPQGSVKVTGTTPCGLLRETCVKCEDGKLPNGTCDTNCNNIVKDKDVIGCPMERCVKKECPKMGTLPTNCVSVTTRNVKSDRCGCMRWATAYCDDVQWKMINGHLYHIHSNAKTWQQALAFCKSKGAWLAIIEDQSEETALRNLPQLSSTYHWVGARCEKRGGRHHYFWDTPQGQIPFSAKDIADRGGNIDDCDTNRDGILIQNDASNPWDDQDEKYGHRFICEIQMRPVV